MDGIKYVVFTEKSLRLLRKNQYTSNVEFLNKSIREQLDADKIIKDGYSLFRFNKVPIAS